MKKVVAGLVILIIIGALILVLSKGKALDRVTTMTSGGVTRVVPDPFAGWSPDQWYEYYRTHKTAPF